MLRNLIKYIDSDTVTIYNPPSCTTGSQQNGISRSFVSSLESPNARCATTSSAGCCRHREQAAGRVPPWVSRPASADPGTAAQVPATRGNPAAGSVDVRQGCRASLNDARWRTAAELLPLTIWRACSVARRSRAWSHRRGRAARAEGESRPSAAVAVRESDWDAVQAGASGTGRLQQSNWERYTLGEGIELHARRPASREEQRRVERILAAAARILNE